MEKTIAKKNTKKTTSSDAVVSPTMEATIYTQAGKENGTITLSEGVFGLKWNADLVHQVVVSMESSARTSVAHSKNRGEVRGGGKKPWKQKGTGRARHGSNRSPIWVGGGVTHGPRNDKNYDRKVNKKMKAKALYTILSAKFKKGQILFIDSLAFKAPKTKEAQLTLSSFSKIGGFTDILSKKRNSAYIAISKDNVTTKKSFGNLGNVEVDEIRNINPVDLMKYKYVVIENPAESLATISSKLA
ncbi:MAG: 50S ribosomal protein L4 [Candidatus Zambryskibacteria bacterium]|nr:50S ribosomal protein L4 [Candidatus Zambryskibacteria bacterium]